MQFKVPRKIRQYFMRHFWSYIPRQFQKSSISVSVLIPLAIKDIDNAALAVESIKQNLLHPIDQIIIVGQNNEKIPRFTHEVQLPVTF